MSADRGSGLPGEERSSGEPVSPSGRQENEAYYSLETDDMLRVDRRRVARPQVVWGMTDDLEPRFADHVQIAKVGSHYHLTFGQSHVPITGDSGAIPVHDIRPIARMIIPKDVIRRLITLIQTNPPD